MLARHGTAGYAQPTVRHLSLCHQQILHKVRSHLSVDPVLCLLIYTGTLIYLILLNGRKYLWAGNSELPKIAALCCMHLLFDLNES